jgi:MFS family permease
MGLIPHMAVNVLHQSKSYSNVLASFQGVGAVIGALTITPLVLRFGRSYMLRAVLLTMAAASSLYVTATAIPQALFGIFFLGTATAMTFSMLGGINQRDAPAAKRGRIFSLYNAAAGTTYGLGIMVFGILTDRFGIRPAFLVGAGCLATFGVLVRSRESFSATVDHDDPTPRRAPSVGAFTQPS